MEDTEQQKGLDPDAESRFLIFHSPEDDETPVPIFVPEGNLTIQNSNESLGEQAKLPTGEVINCKNSLQPFPNRARNTTKSTPGITHRIANKSDPALASGVVIDSKNTLQSIRRPMSSTNNTASSNPLTLPSGEVIDSKNTLQSFRTRRSGPSPSPNPDINAEVENVYIAELVTERPRQKTTIVLIAIGVLAIVVAIVVTGVCLSGNCGSKNPPTETKKATVPPTMSPTAAPTSTDVVVQSVVSAFINNITYLGQRISMNGTSAESRALKWVTNSTEGLLFTEDESALLKLNSFIADDMSFRVRQRYALATLWFQQADEDGVFFKTWETVTGWVQEKDECDWFGIDCVNGSVTNILFYNYDTNVPNEYVGSISPDIGLLPSLETFVMRSNKVTGSIPESIGNCRHIIRFDIRGFDFGEGGFTSGTLPSSIGQWADITYFDVSQNQNIIGTIPESTKNWVHIESFYAFDNQLSGSIPSFIGQWSNVNLLQLSFNTLTNTIPEEIGNLGNISVLGLARNRLTGMLPFSIGRMTALQKIFMYDNALTGTIPSSIGNWSLIIQASFEMNNFTGTMPVNICKYIQDDDTLTCDCSVNCTCCTRCQ
jgi:Leucine-rich repeat (LRR) protein